MILVTDITEAHIGGFHAVLDAVSREKKYLAWTEAPSLEATSSFVRDNIAKGVPQVVAVENEKVVGWCDITPHVRPTTAHCGTLGMGVLAAYRGKGIGSRLMEGALSRARKLGLKRVELEVFEENEAAIRFYLKTGFVHEGKKISAVQIDGRYINTLIMALFLD